MSRSRGDIHETCTYRLNTLQFYSDNAQNLLSKLHEHCLIRFALCWIWNVCRNVALRRNGNFIRRIRCALSPKLNALFSNTSSLILITCDTFEYGCTMPYCRNWLHYFQTTCTVSRIDRERVYYVTKLHDPSWKTKTKLTIIYFFCFFSGQSCPKIGANLPQCISDSIFPILTVLDANVSDRHGSQTRIYDPRRSLDEMRYGSIWSNRIPLQSSPIGLGSHRIRHARGKKKQEPSSTGSDGKTAWEDSGSLGSHERYSPDAGSKIQRIPQQNNLRFPISVGSHYDLRGKDLGSTGSLMKMPMQYATSTKILDIRSSMSPVSFHTTRK